MRGIDRPATKYLMIPFSSMLEDLNHELWNEDEMAGMLLNHLQILAQLLGAPRSGSKGKIITRTLAVRQVHLKLKGFTIGQHDLVAATFNREQMRWMARETRVPRSLNKRTMAFLLLAWKAAAQMRGEKVLAELMKGNWDVKAERPIMALLPLIRRIYARAEYNRARKGAAK